MTATVSKVGTEILVNTATADVQYQQITALSNGGFVVTWQDHSLGVGGATGDSSDFAVKAQVFAADGTRVGSELLVNTATAGDQQLPQITALSNGGFVVTWDGHQPGRWRSDGGQQRHGREGAGVPGGRHAAWARNSWSTPRRRAIRISSRSRRCRTAASW